MSDEYGDEDVNANVFFEKQQYCLCGIHALNNMVGRHWFNYYDIDFNNKVGNYPINTLIDVFYRKTNLILHRIFVGNDFHYVKDEVPDVRSHYERIGLHALSVMEYSQCHFFLCQRRMHFFALRLIDGEIIMIDSTKPSLYRFPKEKTVAFGHLLVRVQMYCTS